MTQESKNKFIFNYVDPAYYYIYTSNNEGFIQENKFLNKINNKNLLPFLYVYLLKKSFDDELKLINIGINMLTFIVSLGKINLLKFLTDKTKELIKDKTIDIIIEKDWLGIYNKINKYLGIEIKNETDNI